MIPSELPSTSSEIFPRISKGISLENREISEFPGKILEIVPEKKFRKISVKGEFEVSTGEILK